ncbi:MAG TPA: TetR/AcrR family transcriptional regulator, partial [Clostridiales bacterium]|nr:TetR/AcrR family transcriptional regulator [Clostridiales bacterium]
PADSEPHMLYVFETAIQLAIAETSENLRDIYVEAYTNRETLCY